MALRTHYSPELCGLNWGQQFPHVHKVIVLGSSRKSEDPPNFENAPVAQFS
jgi:hypothetical protein